MRLASRRVRATAFALTALLLTGACFWMLNEHADTSTRSQPSQTSIHQGAPKPSEGAPDVPTGSSPTTSSVAAAKRVAARFLTGYLAYTYQQEPAEALRDVASPQLVRELADSPPRPAATDTARTQRRAKVLAITRGEDGGPAGSIALLAIIDDGTRIYSLQLTLRTIDGAWRVAQVQGQ